MTKAFTYFRCSGLAQVDGDTWDRQREAVTKYAKANDITVEREFIEAAVSGTNELELRPEMIKMLAAIEVGDVRLVLVETSSRLARDSFEAEMILREFRKAGCKIVTSSGTELTVGSENPTSKMIRQLLAVIDEWDRNMIVQKLAVARARIRATGRKCEGRKEQVSALDLSRIREMRAIGDNLKIISATMTEYGPNRWHVTTLRAICHRHQITKLNNEIPVPEWLKP